VSDAVESPVLDAPASPGRAFVRVAEVWTPDDGRLRLSSGAYGGHDAFEAASHPTSFARGEGLPGRAWERGAPVVLRELRAPSFLREEAAAAAGLAAGVAVPVFAAGVLRGVVTLFFGGGGMGAVEAWRAGEDTGDVMAQSNGHYGEARHFEWISRHTRFPRGQGLPGTVWASGRAAIWRDLGETFRFVRSEGAAEAGLTAGLGIPVPSPARDAHVVTLLSARGTPLARRFEVWAVEDGAPRLLDGVDEQGCALPDPGGAVRWTGLLAEAARTGVPVASSDVAGAPPGAAERPAAEAGLGSLVALPIHDAAGAVVQVAAWYA
jgi:hypothetical protein